MYPNIYELVLDLFGLSIPPLKLMQSYGTMVALGFIFTSIVLTIELKRKEREGTISTTKKKVWEGKGMPMIDKITNTFFAFIIGFKLTPLIANYDAFSNNLKDFFLSLEGSWPGGLLFAGALLGWIFYKDKKKKNKTPIQVEQEIHAYDQVGNLVVLAAIGGIGGAKLFHNLENIDELIADPIGALTGMSGLSFFGGLICGAALIVYYCRKQNIKVLHLVDATMPGLAMAYGFGRLGCQVAGDGDWGIPNDNPKPEWLSWLPDWMWAYDYPNSVLNQAHDRFATSTDFMIDYYARHGYESLTGYAYPTPVYEIIMSIVIFAVLWSMRKRWKTPGIMMSWYLVLTGIERLLIEQIRINNEYPILGGITQAEIISVLLIFLGLMGLYYMPKVGEKWAKW